MTNVDPRATAPGAVVAPRPGPSWSLRGRGPGVQWAVLLVLSAVFTLLFEALRLPAALMLGPMVGGMLVAGCETTVGVPRLLFRISQTLIGCLMARAISPGIVATLAQDWAVFLFATLSVIVAASLTGWLLAWLKVLPGNTAVWGTSPGGATVMTLMSESFGADLRVVAFMQYARMVMVSGLASIIASFWSPGQHISIAGLTWFPPLSPTAFGGTLALTALGTLVGPFLGTPAGPLLLSFGFGAVGHAAGLLEIELPLWLLAASYALFGWSIGLRFNREILLHVAHLLPRILASILLLIAICAVLGVLLSWATGVDEMTAYLAMSPGGTDSVAIIASSVPVDSQFVMSLQAARFVLVMFMAPGLAKLIVRRIR